MLSTSAVRLQCRWEIASPSMAARLGGQGWVCYYELVLPLVEGDARSLDARGRRVRDELLIEMSAPAARLAGTSPPPCAGRSDPGSYVFDTPFSMGPSVFWDSEALPGIRVVAIAPDGTIVERPEGGDPRFPRRVSPK